MITKLDPLALRRYRWQQKLDFSGYPTALFALSYM